MTILGIVSFIFLIGCLSDLFSSPYKVDRDEMIKMQDLKKKHGESVTSHPSYRKVIHEKVGFAIIISSIEFIIAAFVAKSHFFGGLYVYAALIMGVLIISKCVEYLVGLEERWEKYMQNPGKTVQVPFRKVILGKTISSISSLFYALVLARVLGFDINAFLS